MAIKPTLIYTDQPGEVPATYRLPPGFDARIASVSAEYDGSAAADAFHPCLSLYSQDNRLVGRWFPSTELQAGDSAEVTFGPFLGATGGGAGAATLYSAGRASRSSSTFTLTSTGSFQNCTLDTVEMSTRLYDTVNGDLRFDAGSLVFDTTGGGTILCRIQVGFPPGNPAGWVSLSAFGDKSGQADFYYTGAEVVLETMFPRLNAGQAQTVYLYLANNTGSSFTLGSPLGIVCEVIELPVAVLF